MATSKYKGKVLASPVGELHWVFISGKGKENYNRDGYEYAATVYLKGEPAFKFIKQIEELLDEGPAGMELRSLGYKALVEGKRKDGTTGLLQIQPADAPNGHDFFAFTYKTKVTLPDGKAKIIKVVDSRRKEVKLAEPIGNGSVGCLSGTVKRWDNARGSECGVALYLNAVQLVKYIPYSGSTGFDEQEDGYVYEASADDAGFTENPEEADTTYEKPNKDKSFKL